MQIKPGVVLVTFLVAIMVLMALNDPQNQNGAWDIASKPVLRFTIPAFFGTDIGIVLVLGMFFISIFFAAWIFDADRPKLDFGKTLFIIITFLVFAFFVLNLTRESSKIRNTDTQVYRK